MHLRVGIFAAAILFSPLAVFGQHFSYGVVAGTALTDDFNSLYAPGIDGSLPTILKSGGKGIIVGPMLEWRFSPHFAIEADGLFRELRFEDKYAGAHNPTVTWEFPILAKYRFASFGARTSALRPFVEAGPSFRTTGNLNARPSHAGVSAGGGIDFRVRNFAISPALRYTRWAQDNSGFHSRADQIELLVGFSHSATADALPFGKRLSFGAVLGVNLLGDYHSASDNGGINLITGAQSIFSIRSGPRSFLIGPAVEFRVAGDLSVEADAVYRPVRDYYTITEPGFTSSCSCSEVTWQFPVLAKYKLPLPLTGDKLSLFVEAGPSFRIPQTVTNFGFTAGGGVSMHVGPLKIAPVLRYTRWQADFSHMRANEADLLVGITF
jgi:hypothetical protein